MAFILLPSLGSEKMCQGEVTVAALGECVWGGGVSIPKFPDRECVFTLEIDEVDLRSWLYH